MSHREQQHCSGLDAIARKAAAVKKETPRVVALGSLSSMERAEIRRALDTHEGDAW